MTPDIFHEIEGDKVELFMSCFNQLPMLWQTGALPRTKFQPQDPSPLEPYLPPAGTDRNKVFEADIPWLVRHLHGARHITGPYEHNGRLHLLCRDLDKTSREWLEDPVVMNWSELKPLLLGMLQDMLDLVNQNAALAQVPDKAKYYVMVKEAQPEVTKGVPCLELYVKRPADRWDPSTGKITKYHKTEFREAIVPVRLDIRANIKAFDTITDVMRHSGALEAKNQAAQGTAVAKDYGLLSAQIEHAYRNRPSMILRAVPRIYHSFGDLNTGNPTIRLLREYPAGNTHRDLIRKTLSASTHAGLVNWPRPSLIQWSLWWTPCLEKLENYDDSYHGFVVTTNKKTVLARLVGRSAPKQYCESIMDAVLTEPLDWRHKICTHKSRWENDVCSMQDSSMPRVKFDLYMGNSLTEGDHLVALYRGMSLLHSRKTETHAGMVEGLIKILPTLEEYR